MRIQQELCKDDNTTLQLCKIVDENTVANPNLMKSISFTNEYTGVTKILTFSEHVTHKFLRN